MLIIWIVGTVILVGFMIGGLTGAPWLPTRRRDTKALLKDCNLRPGQLLIELGCGDGRLLAAAARSGARAVGYEINPLLWAVAALRNARRYPTVKVRLANFWSKPLGSADVVLVFLIPRYMARLEAKAVAEMKPGSRLVSYIFKLPKKRPHIARHHWYVYTF